MRPRLDATQSELSKDGKAALGRFESKQRLNDLDNELGLRDVEYRLRLFNLSNDCRTAASKVGRQLIG
ncbi:hypothetical protein SAMN02787076_00479 [Rhizobacter sp. OV335]|nr:hypothetical protein SAMN02787076_00479 [Rhizobacter sp. OV335]